MNNSLKTIAFISGIVILAYVVYTLFKPETQISIGDVDLIEAQDNTNSYITIAVGIVIVALSSIIGKK